MVSTTVALALVGSLLLFIHYFFIVPLLQSPLARIPGPRLYALTIWRLALEDWNGTRTRTIHQLHRKYGPVVRVGPNEVAFNSLTALRTIYGAGSGSERTSFYSMFDVYNKQNLFTFSSVHQHSARKKILAHSYSKSAISKNSANMIQQKVQDFLNLVTDHPSTAEELFSSLHYFSLDSITDFLYGPFGRTECLKGGDRDLLQDILDVDRRKLSWFAVHLPSFTKWLYSRSGITEFFLRPLYPMRRPMTYTGIRRHALESWSSFKESSDGAKHAESNTILGKLWQHHQSQKKSGLDDMEIASECADHLLAGIDTTADTLMFMMWILSRPENLMFQHKLQHEIRSLPSTAFDANGIAPVEICGQLKYLDAVIKETLRLYAPLPASEPRKFPQESTIDGYVIPVHTVVSMSPYSLHRNADVFNDPTRFNPDRWMGKDEDAVEMNRWFWAFSSGGRMCIGIHLAMAEMTTLATAVYRSYSTALKPGYENASPGATSRFEVLHDDAYNQVTEHKCHILFKRQ